jgi:hypothetical protein
MQHRPVRHCIHVNYTIDPIVATLLIVLTPLTRWFVVRALGVNIMYIAVESAAVQDRWARSQGSSGFE